MLLLERFTIAVKSAQQGPSDIFDSKKFQKWKWIRRPRKHLDSFSFGPVFFLMHPLVTSLTPRTYAFQKLSRGLLIAAREHTLAWVWVAHLFPKGLWPIKGPRAWNKTEFVTHFSFLVKYFLLFETLFSSATLCHYPKRRRGIFNRYSWVSNLCPTVFFFSLHRQVPLDHDGCLLTRQVSRASRLFSINKVPAESAESMLIQRFPLNLSRIFI